MDQIPEINCTQEAGHVYLLMQDEYRISRNARASWYFQHLNKGITADPPDADNKELKVLSVVPKVNGHSTDTEDKDEAAAREVTSYHVTPITVISFLAKKYRFVFVLDLSPSMASVDLTSEEVLLDELYTCLCSVITGLLNPFKVPGCHVELEPDMYITVVAHTPLINCRSNQVLIQGCHLTRSNVTQVLQTIAEKLRDFENGIAKSMEDALRSEQDDVSQSSQDLLGGSLEDLEDVHDLPDQAFHLISPDSSFVNMLRYGMLALHLLNEHSASGIIILTDGIVGSPDAALFESLMMQLRHNSIAVSFLQIGHWVAPQVGLGQVPYNELMQFIATATFGSYFTTIRDKLPTNTLEMNVYQRALLTWSFQQALAGLNVDGWQVEMYEELNENLAWTHTIPSLGENQHLWATPLIKKKYTERNVPTALCHLISCRLREGYTIKQLVISKGDSQIEVHLVLPWRDKVWIHYVATSAWPLNAGKRHTHIEVTIEGSYAFLHDVTCPQKKPFKSPYRTAVVRKYWQTLQGMSESDQLLVHLQSFSASPNYKVPESVQKGVPLFYLPPHTNSPQVNIQLNSKDVVVSQFASFWKPMLMLDVNIWQKWMHTHRIGLILEHDKPPGKHLHTPNSSGRFHTVTCRQAQAALNVFLSEASTFVLLENNSYISLIFEDPDSSPTSFYMLRVVHKPPCLVLRLAFLGGTSGKQRYKIVADLTEGIRGLMFPRRGTAKSDKTKKEELPGGTPDGPTSTNRLQRPWSETPCCHIMTKPMEKILMRYDRVPYDFLVFELPQPCELSGLSLPVSTVNRAASSVFMTLSRYLYHRRWVWSVQSAAAQSMTTQAVGRILSTLTKIRLQEGFLFANASSGIINMLAEVDMKQEEGGEGTEEESSDQPESDRDHQPQQQQQQQQLHACVIQYLIFPPHTTTLTESMDDLEEQDTPEADREQQIITEVWVEPQYGTVTGSPPEQQHFDSMRYHQLALATLPTDRECISTMVTFEYLNLMCFNTSVPSPTCSGSLPVHPSPALLDLAPDAGEDSDKAVQRMPFAFDLMQVLSKCQQAELLFSMFTQDGPCCECGAGSPGSSQGAGGQSQLSEESPNIVLLTHFLQRMEEAHDRELHLQDEECAMLRELILQRPRDQDAGPPPLHHPIQRLSTDDLKLEAGSPAKVAVVASPARWRCFIRSVRDTHLILCFVPSSLEDLCALVHTPRSTPHEAAGVGSNGAEQFGEPTSRGEQSTATGEETQQEETQDEDTLVDEDTDAVHDSSSTSALFTAHVAPSAAFTNTLSPIIDVESPPTVSKVPDTFSPLREEVPVDLVDTLSTGGTPISTMHPADASLLAEGQHVEASVKHEDGGQIRISDDVAQMDPSRVSNSPNSGPAGSKATTSKVKDAVIGSSLTIPIYVYNCPLSGITDQLVNRWSFQHPQDIYQDMTTKPDMCYGDLRTSLTEDGAGPDRHRMDSETIRDRIRQSAEERTDVGPSVGTDFRHHLSLINEHYHRSFVIGVYTSLRAGHKMHGEDVDAVINGICEESLPIEMNITRYLHNTCGHIRRLVERAKIEQMMREDTAKMVPNAVHTKEEECPEPEGEILETAIKEPSPLSPIVLLPGSPRRALDSYNYPDRTPVYLPLALLTANGTCDEAAPSLHYLIQRKFSQIISQYFRPVPTHPEFFFYSPPDSKPKSSTSNLDTTGGAFNTSATGGSREPEAEIYREDVFASDDEDDLGADADSECDLDSLGSASDNESNLSDLRHPVGSRRVPPLFIHLICSVRSKGRALRSMAIRNLPTCLGDLKSCLNDVTGSIDLCDLQVTMDIICLTLPTEQEFAEYMERPAFNRMTSYNSQASHFSGGPVTHEREETLSISGKLTKEVYDSLRCLSPDQLHAVNACKDEVMWLLRDEIASALRQTVPVTSETLEMVAHHVSSSENKPCCIRRMVQLQFVYGPEQSLTNFIQSFERIELPGYLLNKEANYYYLLLDHARTNNLAHAEAVSSALHALYADSKTFKETTTAFIQSGNNSTAPNVGSNSQANTTSAQASTISTQPSTASAQWSTASTQSSSASRQPNAATLIGPSVASTKPNADSTQQSTPSIVQSNPRTPTQLSAEDTQRDAAYSVKLNATPLQSNSLACLLKTGPDVTALSTESAQPSSALPEESAPSAHAGIGSLQEAPESTQPEVESVLPSAESAPSVPAVEAWKGMAFAGGWSSVEDPEGGERDGRRPRMVGYVDMGELHWDGLEASRSGCLDGDGTARSALSMRAATLDSRIGGGGGGQHSVVSPSHVEHSDVPEQSEATRPEEGHVLKEQQCMGVESEQEGDPAGEDIKISVIRPSPVKEARRATGFTGMTTVGGTEMDDTDESFTVPSDTSIPKSTYEVPPARTLQFVGIDSPGSEPMHLNSVNMLMGGRPLTKRTGSGTSLDKLRSSNRAASTPGGQTPNRSRHQSGIQTPLSGSVFDAASQGSIEEKGYDGGSSDSDEEGIMMSFSESMLRYRQLPDFWLIMEIKQDRVDVYFHTRDTGDKATSWIDQQQLVDHVIVTITKKCRTVNQLLLLQDLSNTRQCNQLLVPEADEDVQWPGEDKVASISTRHKSQVSDMDSDDSDSEAAHQGRYLEAALHVRPGYFACDCVWRKEFVLHPRLKNDPRRMDATHGIQVLKRVLDTFAVTNRKNMFVIPKANASAVFYLRLEHSRSPRHHSGQSATGDRSPGTKVEEDPVLMSRSSSLLSLPHKVKAPDAEEDIKTTTPRTSTTDPLQQKSPLEGTTGDEDALLGAQTLPPTEAVSEGSIILSAYGIGNVGPDISQELVTLLQKRLDIDVLNTLVALFARNPMFKLMPEDVKFIKPEGSAAKQVVRLTIPPAALLHQPALSYYLHQNLLQFLHTPKYAEPGPETVFRDYTLPNAPPIPENQVFLCCTKPQHAGGKGISCIHQTFVDGQGNPIQLIGSPKPLPAAYKDKLDPTMFESMISTQVYVPSPGSKGPGPTALVQFAVWERGEREDNQLVERLKRAMKHAVCDIVIEYRLLTAPLCDVPAHYSSGIDSPMHSAPQSPVTHFISSAEQRSASGATESSKKVNEGGRTPKEKTVFNLHSLFKSKSGSRDSPKGSSPGLSQPWHAADGQCLREKAELRQKIQKYEVGDCGSLQPIFSNTMVEWFEFCTKLGVPSVQSLQLNLTSRFSLEYVLRETPNVLTTLAGDVICRVFRLTECSNTSHRENHPPIYLPYSTARAHDPKSELVLELPACSQVHVPGKAAEYLLVARNVQQWRASIDYQDVDEEAAAEYTHPRVQKTLQKFLPQESSPPGLEKVEFGLGAIGQTPLETWFVPRQRLVLATIKDKQITMYTYNWAQTLQGSLESQITKMVTWHNARSLLLTSILSQKAGLFHLPTTHEHSNMYLCTGDLQPLVKYTNPPHTTPSGRPRAMSTGQRSAGHSGTGHGGVLHSGVGHAGASLLQGTFRDQRPATSMHKSSYGTLRDPLHRHGAQMIELKRSNKKEEEKNGVLMHLYENWQQRMGPSHAPINETDLELLRTCSRLIHSVASPLLLSPHWRQKVLPKPPGSRHDSRASDTAKPRSRHSSGASIRSKRSDSMDSKKRVDSPDIGGPGHRPAVEEMWHVELRASFVSQYIQYLQSLGFVQVRTRSASPKRGCRHPSGDILPPKTGTGDPRLVVKPNYTYLQKTLPGGIMLLEVGFKEVFFCIYVYAFECSRLPIRSINPQLAVIFTDECEKFKDLTHVHSFAHDFHLRTVQSYITGHHLVLGQNYHLSGFLHDMIQYYPYAPSFSRNYILSGVCNLPLATNNASTQLFRYMLDHDKLYGMRAIRMMLLVEDDQEMDSEDVLVKQFSWLAKDRDRAGGSGSVASEPAADYEGGLVVTHDTQGLRLTDLDRPMLRLKYYVLLTSRKELFPKQTLEKRLGMFKSTVARQYPAGGSVVEVPVEGDDENDDEDDFVFDDPPVMEEGKVVGTVPQQQAEKVLLRPVEQYVAARQDTTNYLGYTNKHQISVVKMLLRQAEYARKTIQAIVGSAMSQCRRDLLWQRMLLPGNVTEEEGRRKRRSEHDEGKEPYLTRLSFSEFQELLSIVTRVQLSAIDGRLTILENMNTTWYLNLVRVLRLQYGPNHQYGASHRYFSSSDGHVQYVVVLNPNFLDTFMMLGVDSTSNKTELCAVYREPLPNQTHTPNTTDLQAFAVQTLMEGFVNTCFYHMWTGLL